MTVNPYLTFEGRCEEAIEFYKKNIGAEVIMLSRFKDMPGDCPDGSPSAANREKVMHAELKIGDSLLFLSDGRCTGATKFEGITLTISVSSDAQAQKIFSALTPGGKVHMPLTKTFFATQFGMLNDRFGVGWMIIARA